MDKSTTSLRHLVRLWHLHLWLDLLWIARDWRSALIFIFIDLFTSLSVASSTFLIAARFDGIGDWTFAHIVFMVGFGLIVKSILSMFVSFNILEISRRIGRGQLDHILIQPRPMWVAFITEGLAPVSEGFSIFPGLFALGWAIYALGLPITIGWLIAVVANAFAAAAIVASFSWSIGSVAFWAPRAGEEICSSVMSVVNGLSSFPLDNASRRLQTVLLTAMPVGFVAWLPSRALTGIDPSPEGLLWTPLAAFGFIAVAIAIFRKGLQEYERTGSRRYLSMGHRR